MVRVAPPDAVCTMATLSTSPTAATAGSTAGPANTWCWPSGGQLSHPAMSNSWIPQSMISPPLTAGLQKLGGGGLASHGTARTDTISPGGLP